MSSRPLDGFVAVRWSAPNLNLPLILIIIALLIFGLEGWCAGWGFAGRGGGCIILFFDFHDNMKSIYVVYYMSQLFK